MLLSALNFYFNFFCVRVNLFMFQTATNMKSCVVVGFWLVGILILWGFRAQTIFNMPCSCLFQLFFSASFNNLALMVSISEPISCREIVMKQWGYITYQSPNQHPTIQRTYTYIYPSTIDLPTIQQSNYPTIHSSTIQSSHYPTFKLSKYPIIQQSDNPAI